MASLFHAARAALSCAICRRADGRVCCSRNRKSCSADPAMTRRRRCTAPSVPKVSACASSCGCCRAAMLPWRCAPPCSGLAGAMTERHPLVVINHGTSELNRMSVSMPVYYWLSRWFVDRGYAVVLPQRRGHGATGGTLVEAVGDCANPDHYRSGVVAAQDVGAAVDLHGAPAVRRSGARSRRRRFDRRLGIVGAGFAAARPDDRGCQLLRAAAAVTPGGARTRCAARTSW